MAVDLQLLGLQLIDGSITHLRFILLIIGFICSFFSLGFTNIPIFIFIWPFCFLYFQHHEPRKWLAVPTVALAILVANSGKWKGNSGVSFTKDLQHSIYWSIVQWIPFIIDGFLYGTIEKWKSVFIFPLLVSSFEFIFSIFTTANINYYALSQLDNLSLCQMVALFGPFGLSFMLALPGSLLDYTVDHYLKTSLIPKGIYFYIAVLFYFQFYGGCCLLDVPKSETIKAVAVPGLSQIGWLTTGKKSTQSPEQILEYIEKYSNMSNTIGAKLLSFAEESFYFNIDNAQKVLEGACKIAIEKDIHLSLGLDVIVNTTLKRNTAVFIDNHGNVRYNYIKHNLISAAEVGYEVGSHKVEVFDTDIGKVSTVICYDLNFPHYVNKVGSLHPDLLVVPAWDWGEVIEFQAGQTRLRAIENGVNIIKNTMGGVIIVYDILGRVLTRYRSQPATPYFVVMDVYKKGRKTLYSYIGQYWNYLYIIGIFVVLLIKPKFDRKRIFTLEVEKEGEVKQKLKRRITRRITGVINDNDTISDKKEK